MIDLLYSVLWGAIAWHKTRRILGTSSTIILCWIFSLHALSDGFLDWRSAWQLRHVWVPQEILLILALTWACCRVAKPLLPSRSAQIGTVTLAAVATYLTLLPTAPDWYHQFIAWRLAIWAGLAMMLWATMLWDWAAHDEWGRIEDPDIMVLAVLVTITVCFSQMNHPTWKEWWAARITHHLLSGGVGALWLIDAPKLRRGAWSPRGSR